MVAVATTGGNAMALQIHDERRSIELFFQLAPKANDAKVMQWSARLGGGIYAVLYVLDRESEQKPSIGSQFWRVVPTRTIFVNGNRTFSIVAVRLIEPVRFATELLTLRFSKQEYFGSTRWEAKTHHHGANFVFVPKAGGPLPRISDTSWECVTDEILGFDQPSNTVTATVEMVKENVSARTLRRRERKGRS